MGRHWIVALVAGLALVPALPLAASADAAAESGRKCSDDIGLYSQTGTDSDNGDKGGRDAWGNLREKGSGTLHYRVLFKAKGDKLFLYDQKTDGCQAKGIVKVYKPLANGDSKLVDTDTFSTGEAKKYYNLGTPDGSGNIPEGYFVRINVCKNGFGCSQPVYGIA